MTIIATGRFAGLLFVGLLRGVFVRDFGFDLSGLRCGQNLLTLVHVFSFSIPPIFRSKITMSKNRSVNAEFNFPSPEFRSSQFAASATSTSSSASSAAQPQTSSTTTILPNSTPNSSAAIPTTTTTQPTPHQTTPTQKSNYTTKNINHYDQQKQSYSNQNIFNQDNNDKISNPTKLQSHSRLSSPPFVAGINRAEMLRFEDRIQNNDSGNENITPHLSSAQSAAPRSFGSRGIDSTTAKILARQEEIDHRENQLNARMAQFETLVRNTKVSLQAKMEEVSQREQQLNEISEQLEYRQNSHNEWIQSEKTKLENEYSNLNTRKLEIEERLTRQEQELQQLAAQREDEIVANAKIYREQLEAKLHECKTDYQDRYEKKCKEFEAEFDKQVRLEKLEYDSLRESLERQFEIKLSDMNRELETARRELDAKFTARQTELDRQTESKQREIADSFERRFAMLNDEFEQKNSELESKHEKREYQLTQREILIKQAEEDWNNRRELFESQWSEFEQLRNSKLDELAKRESQIEDKNIHLSEFDAKLKKREVELETIAESLKAREYQISLEAPRYANLQQREAELIESQSEAARIREALVKERHQMQKAAEAERKRLRDTQELAMRRIDDEKQNLIQQNKKLEQMRLAIERSREELGRMHRETLEIRLATEELWIRIAGDSVSEDLKTSVANIRTELTEEYRASMARIDSKKQELEENRNDILKQYETLITQREELDKWIETNEQSIKERETTLAMREEELDRRQAKIDELLARTQQERTDMEKEIRLLQEQIDIAFDTQKAA
ncbi:MAG: hypothetical protein LBQ66_01820 [Planctomycetaceae bacterium]|nr:hypothetical protein [Planctomycetaceae bacterium]